METPNNTDHIDDEITRKILLLHEETYFEKILEKSKQQIKSKDSPNDQFQNVINFDENLLNLDLNKLRLFISVLEEHEYDCEKKEKFPEASLSRDKIKLLKEVEEIKIVRDLDKLQNNQVSIL
jgi:hypothetical protein